MKKLAILLLTLMAVASYIGAVKYTNYKDELQQSEEIARIK